jgi:hypothetical protein
MLGSASPRPSGGRASSWVRISGLFPTSPTLFGVCFDLRDSFITPHSYGLDSITDDDERRPTLEHLFDDNIYMLRAIDRDLPVDVRLPHLSSRGLSLADSVLSQRSASVQSVASIPVRYLSCHVFALANGRFSQRSASVQSVASIPVCYLSCYVFAIANRRFSQPSLSPDPAAAPYSVVPPCPLTLPLLGWLRVGGPGGLVDGLFGSGLVVGVRLFYMLYLFNLECVPMLLCACFVPL